jgi:hypothetical protein
MEKPPMSARSNTIESPAVQPIRQVLARIAFGVTGMVAVMTTLLSAATIWLVLTRPLAMADALGEGQVTQVVRVLAGLVVTMLRDLVSYL